MSSAKSWTETTSRGPRRLAAALAAALIAISLAACGGDDDADEPGERDEPAAQAPPRANLQEIGTFEEPLYVAQPRGSSDLYVVEKGGTVRIVREGETLITPFLDISDEVSTGGEQGLLSIAFDPDYTDSGLLYVNYTDLNGDTRVQEMERDEFSPDRVDSDSRRELLFIDQPFSNHNGGLLLFGPDRRLYIGTGDGGGSGDPNRNALDTGSLLGKILRVDLRVGGPEGETTEPTGGPPYIVPRDNPFADEAGGSPEVFAYGLRNPWRFSFDRETDDLWIADVGQAAWEEINHVPLADAAGANFGWSAYEGEERFNSDQEAPDHRRPVHTYPLNGDCSVTGGYVVRDPDLPGLEGRYVYGDYCGGELRSLVVEDGEARDDRPVGPDVPGLSSFGEDNRGRIYATSLEGPVYRLVPRRQDR